MNSTRRNFILSGMAVAGTIAGSSLLKQRDITASPTQPMPERILGNTGVSVPILGLGGAGKTPLSWHRKEAEVRNLIEKALTLGIVNFQYKYSQF